MTAGCGTGAQTAPRRSSNACQMDLGCSQLLEKSFSCPDTVEPSASGSHCCNSVAAIHWLQCGESVRCGGDSERKPALGAPTACSCLDSQYGELNVIRNGAVIPRRSSRERVLGGTTALLLRAIASAALSATRLKYGSTLWPKILESDTRPTATGCKSQSGTLEVRRTTAPAGFIMLARRRVESRRGHFCPGK
jgi:hypothetical protein